MENIYYYQQVLLKCLRIIDLEKKGVLFNIDFKKPYDYVDWIFWIAPWTRRNFGPKWRIWMWRNVSYSFLINGRRKDTMVVLRGLRHRSVNIHFDLLGLSNILSPRVKDSVKWYIIKFVFTYQLKFLGLLRFLIGLQFQRYFVIFLLTWFCTVRVPSCRGSPPFWTPVYSFMLFSVEVVVSTKIRKKT